MKTPFPAGAGCTGFGAFAPENGVFDVETCPFAAPPMGRGVPPPISAKNSFVFSPLADAFCDKCLISSHLATRIRRQRTYRDQRTEIREQRSVRRGPWAKKRERGGCEPPRLGLVLMLLESVCAGRGKLCAKGREKVLGGSWMVLGVGSASIGTFPWGGLKAIPKVRKGRPNRFALESPAAEEPAVLDPGLLPLLSDLHAG